MLSCLWLFFCTPWKCCCTQEGSVRLSSSPDHYFHFGMYLNWAIDICKTISKLCSTIKKPSMWPVNKILFTAGNFSKVCVLFYFTWNSIFILRSFFHWKFPYWFKYPLFFYFLQFSRESSLSPCPYKAVRVIKIYSAKLFGLLIRKTLLNALLPSLNISPSRPHPVSLRFELLECASEFNFSHTYSTTFSISIRKQLQLWIV